MFEIPITVVSRFRRFFGIPTPLRIWLKLDINWLSLSEMKKAIVYLSDKCKYLTLFLHSSSFIISNPPQYTYFKKNEYKLRSFVEILKWLKEMKLKTILFEDIDEITL